MSPDKNLGLSAWYAITDPKKLEEAVRNVTWINKKEAGEVIEDRVKSFFANNEELRDQLLDHLNSLTPPSPRRSAGSKR